MRWQWTAGLPAILHPDSDSYFEIAARLWKGSGLGDLSRRTPLYPILLWLTGKSGAAGFDHTLHLQHALGVATALLTYLTARSVLRYRVPALFAGLAVATAPVFILTEQSILSESLYTFLIVAAGYSLVAFLREHPIYSSSGSGTEPLPTARPGKLSGIACGMALGLAALTRPVGALLLPLWLVALLMVRGRRVAWRFAVGAGVAWLVVLLPLLIRNQQTVGSFSLTQSTGRNLISVTDLRVDYAASEHKDVLGIYHQYLQNKRGPDAVVVYSAMPELRRLTKKSDVEIDRALAATAWEAIVLHPLDFLTDRLKRLPLLFGEPTASQWYALHLETYIPLVEFTGKQNPEMTARSVVNHPLKEIDFPRASAALERWRFPLGGAWFLAFLALGIMAALAGVIAREKCKPFASLRMTSSGGGLLIFLGMAASLLTTILMQPPNLRYRTPTLPWEILLAAAGLALVADLASQAVEVMNRKTGRNVPCWIPNVAVCVAAVGLFAAAQQAPGESAIKVGDFVDSANQPADGPAIIRQMPLAGKTTPMIYWRNDMPAPRTISASGAVSGGGAHRLRVAFSCGEGSCANGQIKLLSFGPLNTALGTQEFPLARERTDNDLFWEQIDERVTLPTGAMRVKVELNFEPGAGSLVIPLISLTR